MPRISYRLVSVAIMSVLLVLALGLVGCGSASEDGEVPDIVGKSPLDAVRALQDAGYLLGDVNSVYSNQVPIGFVVATSPTAGSSAAKGSKVTVSVNAGMSGTITVPDLTGLSQADAEERLTRIGLVPIVAESYDATLPAGQVTAQVPQSGSVMAAGANVVVQISQGAASETVTVPEVAGKTQAAAESALEAAGLTSQVYSVFSDTVAKGNVIVQAPSAGGTVVAGAEVAIAVSLGKGVGAVTVPNVIGKSESDAVSAMQAVGLNAKVYEQYSDTVAKGMVGAQAPTAGTTTGAGAEVAVVVSLGPASTSSNIAVPNVTGKTQAEAVSALESAGFEVQVVEQEGSATAGTVAAQLPVSESTAPAGSKVVIAVSTGPAASGDEPPADAPTE